MSNYTTEVRWICESTYKKDHPAEQGTLNDYIASGRSAIFNFSYPIFDENYRGVLETKILKHYYTREISEETVALWKLRLDARMNEIMPFYNKLYSSELLEFNPLYDVDVTRTYTKEGSASKSEKDIGTHESTDKMTGTVGDSGVTSGTNTMTGTVGDSATSSNTKRRTGTEQTEGETIVDGKVVTANSGSDTESTGRDNKNDHWDYYSDTPQGTIGFIPGSEGTPQADTAVRNQTYLTNVRHVTDDTTGSSEERTMIHGHRIQADDDTTTSVDNTLTLNTTETDQGTSGNTRTYNTTDTTAENNANTRTYNTANSTETETSNTAIGSYTNLDEYTETVKGKHGGLSYAKMLMDFRETFLNIDAMIIENLSDLFFGLWG